MSTLHSRPAVRGRRAILHVVASALASPLAGQAAVDAASMHAFLVEAFEQNRVMDLAIVAAIPDSALRWAPTESMRDFAQQVIHTADNYWIARGLEAHRGALGDSSLYLNDRRLLRETVEDSYRWVLDILRSRPPGDLEVVRDFFGTPTPRWRVYLMAIQHATWTRGQMAPYFHAHGVKVPRFRLF